MAALGGCERDVPPEPLTPPAVKLPTTCVVDDGRRLAEDTFRYDAAYRVDLATGGFAKLAVARDAPLAGPVTASVDRGRLVVQRGGRIVAEAGAAGRAFVAWQIERDGMLYVSLEREGKQTIEALRLAALPRVDAAWCIELDGVPGTQGGGFATANGPLLVRSSHELVAIARGDGGIAWRVPWRDSSAPFSLIESGGNWIACDTDVVAIDRASGAERWRQPEAPDVATDCAVAGGSAWTASRRCATTGCTPIETRTLDAATGAIRSRRPGKPYAWLTALDGDRALVAPAPDRVAVLDARDGTVGPELALGGDVWKAEPLAGGDVLASGPQTTRLATAPLAVRWSAPYRTELHGDVLLATRLDVPAGAAWLVAIDPVSGRATEIALPPVARPDRMPSFEVGRADILGTSPHEVDVALRFGFLE